MSLNQVSKVISGILAGINFCQMKYSNMIQTRILLVALLFLWGCGGSNETGNEQNSANSEAQSELEANETGEEESEENEYDEMRGVGKFTNVEVSPTLDQGLAAKGKEVYDVLCYSCHKLTSERVVGPGWAGVTTRRTPEWIMNFSTNTDEMLNKDPAAQAMLEICLIRMPNQNLSDEQARNVYEFMRQNDGVK
jgi:mono/diheme cytochrome c family protein